MSYPRDRMIAHAPAMVRPRTHLAVLLVLSLTHLLNDLIQALIPAVYPIIKAGYALDFVQIGLITLTFQVAGSLLQPVVGYYTDTHPLPYLTVVGMTFTLAGLLGLAFASRYAFILAAVASIGIGSSIYHPEATRMARLASGGRQGLAQGLFQVGGYLGGALAPLLAAFVIVPRGQSSLAWFSALALLAIVLMAWTAGTHADIRSRVTAARASLSGSACRTRHLTRCRYSVCMTLQTELISSTFS